MTKYVQEPYIWKNFKQNFREWYNNTSPDPLQVKFRSWKVKDVPFIDGSWNPWHKVFDFEKVDLDDIIGLSLLGLATYLIAGYSANTKKQKLKFIYGSISIRKSPPVAHRIISISLFVNILFISIALSISFVLLPLSHL